MSDTTPPPPQPATPALSGPGAPSAPGLDVIPTSGWSAAEKAAFAAQRAEERAAAYLNSIRKMMLVFLIVFALGIIAAVVVGILEMNAINSLKPSRGPVPFG
jgi:hypothetical protein